MKKAIYILIMCIIALEAAVAYDGITVQLVMDTNENFEVASINYLYSDTDQGGAYEYVFHDSDGKEIESGNFFADFWQGFDKVNSIPITLSAQTEDVGELVIYNEDSDEVFREDIGDLVCNNDDKCSGFENYNFCPADCGASADDGFCNRELDGICDPDCGDYDIDCTCGNGVCDQEESFYTGTCPADCEEKTTSDTKAPSKDSEKKTSSGPNALVGVLIVIGILIIGLAIFIPIFLLRKKGVKKKKR